MVLWTRWTRRLDAIALRWRAPSDEPAAEISA
jgi:hypothetical protein